jgi:hypothetical protein
MVTRETDGFKVFATWNHQGMIANRRSSEPAQCTELDTVLDPATVGRKGGAFRAMTADEREAARNRSQNR